MVISMIAVGNPFEHFISFRSSGIMAYSVPVNHSKRLKSSALFNANAQLLKSRERYVGYVTPAIKKRMKRCITLLLQSTPNTWKEHPVTGKLVQHQLSFITLTTPDTENSRDAGFCHKYLLQPMLRVLRRRYSMKSYIWKCELQSNGQIHYHITCDVFTNHTKIKHEWNYIMRCAGLLEEFKKRYGHDEPNSTDIHAVSKVKNMEAYLVKYITKEYQNETALAGKVWDASKNLKKSDYFKVHIESKISEFIKGLTNGLMSRIYCFEKATFIDFMTPDYYSYFSNDIISDFSQFLNNVYNSILQPWTQKQKSTHSWTLQKTSNLQSHDYNAHGRPCTLERQTLGLTLPINWPTT